MASPNETSPFSPMLKYVTCVLTTKSYSASIVLTNTFRDMLPMLRIVESGAHSEATQDARKTKTTLGRVEDGT